MSDVIQLTKDGDIAIITINNPPVNAISPGVPEGISEAIDQINADSTVTAAVVIGGGRTFIAGADIKEFTKMTSGKAKTGPGLLPLLLKVENCSKPVVMAIHGTAFGGGLEVAMSGHYRVAVARRAGRTAGSKTRPHSGSCGHPTPAPPRRRRESS